jgi:hypothetical protein
LGFGFGVATGRGAVCAVVVGRGVVVATTGGGWLGRGLVVVGVGKREPPRHFAGLSAQAST